MRKSVCLIVLLLLIASGIDARNRRKSVAQPPLVCNLSRPYQVAQGLEGEHIALWGSHGRYYNADQDRWIWQRARVWTTVEDLFTSSFTAPYLVPMLEQAGAYVLQPRAYVRPGYQTIYIRWADNQADTLVCVRHGNQQTDYRINPNWGAGYWHYLCTVDKGEALVVNGNGVEVKIIDEHTPGVSGMPCYTEAAYYWLQTCGYPTDILMHQDGGNDYLNDLVCRGKWVNAQSLPVSLCLAIHTDAGAALNDSLIGTMSIYTQRALCRSLAEAVQNQVLNDMRQSVTEDWPDRGILNARYAESRYPEVPCILLEMLSHQNYADMRLGLNPVFRFLMARAIYKGIGRFLAAQQGRDFTPQPLAPAALRTSMTTDSLLLTWQAVSDPLEPTATASYYVVYTRQNGGSWDNGTYVEKPEYALRDSAGVRYDFCVAAGNAGGISMRSSVVSASRAATDSLLPMLVIDAFPEVRGPNMMAFDSLTGGIVPGSRPIPDGYEMAYIGEQLNYNRLDPWHTDDDCGFGMCHTNMQGQLYVGNTHDYTARHGSVLQTMGRSYVSCTMDALTDADSVFADVDIILGKSNEAIVRDMNSTVQRMGWTLGAKHVLMSGAYIGYPRHACASGTIRIDGLDYTFRQEMNTERLSAEDVSALSKNAPSDTIIARYTDTGLPAGIKGTNYILLGLPIETIDGWEDIYRKLWQL